MRAIRYQRRGFPPQLLLTSLLDPERYPAAEVVALYHERWEIELGYNEVKRVMLAREETTRSKSPRGVAQELWGLAIAYNLVRYEAERVAADAGVPPVRISFVAALNFIEAALRTWGDRQRRPVARAPGQAPRGSLPLRPARTPRTQLPPSREDQDEQLCPEAPGGLSVEKAR